MTAPGSDRGLSADRFIEIYEQYRNYLEHEDELMNVRISRTLLLHGFLFAAYGLLAQSVTDVLSKPLEGQSTISPSNTFSLHLPEKLQAFLVGSENLLVTIGMIGVITSLGLVIGVRAAASAINKLDSRWKAIIKRQGSASQLVSRITSHHGCWWNKRIGHLSTYFVPIALLLMWLLVFANTLNPLLLQSAGSQLVHVVRPLLQVT